MAHIVNLEQPAISPDGRSVALISSVADSQRTAGLRRLLIVDVATTTVTTLLSGNDVALPRWSGDGRLAFLAHRSGDVMRIYVRGRFGQLETMPAVPGDVVDFAWRPGGRDIALAVSEPDVNAATRRHKYFEVADNDYTLTEPPRRTSLWLVTPPRGAPRRLVGRDVLLAPTDTSGVFTPQIAWSSDGKQIVFTRLASTATGENERSTIWALVLRTGAMRHLTHHTKLEFSPQPAPRGDALAYSYAAGGDYLAQNTLHVVAGGLDVDVARKLDRNIGGALWMPGDQALFVCADDGPHARAWFVFRGERPRRVELGPLEIVCDSYSSSGFDGGIAASVSPAGAIAFLATTPRRARELYYLASHSATPRRLTYVNAPIESLSLGTMRALAWDGPDGFRETGVLTYPPTLRRGVHAPIVLLIHGGPGLASTTSFVWETWPLAQLIAAHGYVVFSPNYRGSDDSGNAFMRAIGGDTVDGPARDILSGLAYVQSLPNVDPSRVAVSGWSYGGLLTSWLIAQRHDWRCAVTGTAVDDEIESYDLSVSNVQNAYYLGSSPYVGQGRKIYRAQSPIEFAAQVRTPTLIWGTTGDAVVPITMSYAFYHALKDNGVPVKFVVFPSPTHGPGNLAQTEDVTRLWIDWLNRHMK